MNLNPILKRQDVCGEVRGDPDARTEERMEGELGGVEGVGSTHRGSSVVGGS